MGWNFPFFGKFWSSAPTLSDGDKSPPALDVNSNLKANIVALPPLAAGSNDIGTVHIAGTVPVSGSFYQATQPVSIATLPTLTAGSAVVGKFGIDQTTPGTTNAVHATNITSAAALADGTANPTTGHAAADAFVFNGTTWDRLRGDTTSGVWVNVKSMVALPTGANVIGGVTQSGTWTVGVTGTFWQATQPVSLATLPQLPAGPNIVGQVGIDQTTPGTSDSVTPKYTSTGGFWPNLDATVEPDIGAGETTPGYVDGAGNLRIRGPITTDEGSIREDFTGAALTRTLTGTVTLTNGSYDVTGVGTSFTSELSHYDYIKISAHSETVWAQVSSVLDDTTATLTAVYGGATASATAHTSPAKTITGTGGSFTVGTSALTIASGTSTNQVTLAQRSLDYGPMRLLVFASLSQRIVNQTGYIGLQDDSVAPSNYARFVFSGTTNTTCTFESCGLRQGSSPLAGDIQSTTVTLPSGNTSTVHEYRIEIHGDEVHAHIDGELVALHRRHVPLPYAVLSHVTGWINGGSAPASTSSMVIDLVAVQNYDTVLTRDAQIIDDVFNWTQIATATNAIATATRSAVTDAAHYISHISASFSNGTGVQTLTVSDGAAKNYLIQYTAGGQVNLNFVPPLKIDTGQSVSAALGAGGGGIIGRVNMIGYTK